MKFSFKVDNLNEMHSNICCFAEEMRQSDICDDDIFASKLVSCELLTNVIRHGGDTAEFVAELFSDRITITVMAKGLNGVNLRTEIPDVFAESGRGLYIVRCFGELEQNEKGGITVTIKRNN